MEKVQRKFAETAISSVFRQCANFHEKILSTGREIQGIPFFSDVPAIFRKFRLQKSVLLLFYTLQPMKFEVRICMFGYDLTFSYLKLLLIVFHFTLLTSSTHH